jgi:hypothetical protein
MIHTDLPIPATLTPGTVLRNGARVLKARLHSDNESYVVLCEKTAFVQDELVTWRANAALGECFWGHYFRNDEEKALNDYLTR